MDFAAGDRLMTRETAACESPKCSASDLKLTLCLSGFRTKGAGPDLERGIRGVWSGSLAHQTVAGQALPSACRSSVSTTGRVRRGVGRSTGKYPKRTRPPAQEAVSY